MFNFLNKKKETPAEVVNIVEAEVVTADNKTLRVQNCVIWAIGTPGSEMDVKKVVDYVVRNAFNHVAENMSFAEIKENPQTFLSNAMEWANLDRSLCGLKLIVVLGRGSRNNIV